MNTEPLFFRRYVVLAILLAVVCAFAFQGSRGLYESTEGRYTLCAWEMVKSGNWMEPTLLGNHHWTKPPMGYWAIAGGLTFFPNEWGARLSNSLAFVLTALLVGLLAARMWHDRRTGVLAALVYGTAFFPVMTATTINTDTLLCLWEVLAVYCFWAAQPSPGATATPVAARWWMLGMWAAFGLGFFTKGPPALLPLLAISVWHFNHNREARRVSPFNPAGILLFLILGFWWFLVMVGRHPELLDYFLKKEVVNRVATNEFGRNPQWYAPFKLYFPLLLLGGGLWIFYFWQPLRHSLRTFRTGVRRAGHHFDPFVAVVVVATAAFWLLEQIRDYVRKNKSSQKLFLVLWLILPLVVFCLSKSRLPTYVLPLFVPVALAVARLARKIDWAEARPRRRMIVLALASAALLVMAKGIAGSTAAIGQFLQKRDYKIAGIPMPIRLEDDIKRNMGDLYRVCKPFDTGRGTRFLLVYENELLGFDFYAKAPVTRVIIGEPLPPPSRMLSLDRLLGSGTSGECLVVICKTNMLPFLEEALKPRGLGLQTYQIWCDRTVAQIVSLPCCQVEETPK